MHVMSRGLLAALLFSACGGVTAMGTGGGAGGGGGSTLDGGDLGDAGENSDAGGRSDAGESSDAGASRDGGPPADRWTWLAVPGSQCASGSTAGLGYSEGDARTLVVFLQGGGACWNNGTCRPSVYRWGPVCNYGQDNVCLYDDSGGTKPLAAHVAESDPYPVDGGGAFPGELDTVRQVLLFTRRDDNPLRDATFVYVPYCTGDLHAGDATRTYFTKADLFSQPVARQHHFAGARNMDLYLAQLRQRHPQVDTVFLVGVSAGGYGATLNFERVRQAFPEATVHLLADCAPLLDTPHWAAWRDEWNLQLPATCSTCDAGLPQTLDFMLDRSATSRVGLLAYTGDQVITRFFYSGDDTGSWLTPPTGQYSAQLSALLPHYDAHPEAGVFVLDGTSHVMIQGYGVVLPDGGVGASVRGGDGGTLRAWLDGWISGVGW